LENVQFPCGVQTLTFGDRFNQELQELVPLRSLSLTFDVNV
jgi:hypothetical protein